MKRTVLAVALLLTLTACGGGNSSQAADTPTTTVTVVVTETVTPSPDPATDSPTGSTYPPKGYPKVVKVSQIPSPVSSAFEGERSALAVAPGVWAHMPPGATMEDALNSGVFDGFCASKTAFERKYLDGEETGGSCW